MAKNKTQICYTNEGSAITGTVEIDIIDIKSKLCITVLSSNNLMEGLNRQLPED